MEAILAKSLCVTYGPARVLDDASLAVPQGGRVVIRGRTGAGKTTLLYILAGLLRPETGTVSLFGAEAGGNGTFMPPEKRGVGMVFQRSLLWPHMTAAGNVEFALCQSGLSKSEITGRAREAMALFGIDSLADRSPDTLSGGQAQRIALARSIAGAPRILLWDEPFTGLDRATRQAVAGRALEYMKASCTTLVAVSHNDEDALLLEGESLLLKDGRIEKAS